MDKPEAAASASDAELVRRARGGETGAFDLLFERHYGKVFSFALRLDGSRDNAADIAQTAFVRAWDALPGMRDGQAVLQWLYRTALNIVRDRAKCARRKPWVAIVDLLGPRRAGGDSEPPELADAGLDPYRALSGQDRDEALRCAIVALPLPFREVIVLHHLEQMDVRAISQALGVAEGTVKSRLGRGRALLRTSMADWVDQGGDGA